jgi:Replication factor A protein 3
MTISGIEINNPAPRVNFQLMNNYVGKRVTLVGKVENGAVENGILKVKTADEGMVDVLVTSMVPQDMFVEIDGIVESANTIRENSITGFGNSFGKLVVFAAVIITLNFF